MKGEGNLVKNLFNVNNLKEGWQTLLKKRQGHARLYIILLILAFELEIFLRYIVTKFKASAWESYQFLVIFASPFRFFS